MYAVKMFKLLQQGKRIYNVDESWIDMMRGRLFARVTSALGGLSAVHVTKGHLDGLPTPDVTWEADGGWRKASTQNPCWPSGVRNGFVDQYVDKILADNKLNIWAVQDSLEKQIYATTVAPMAQRRRQLIVPLSSR